MSSTWWPPGLPLASTEIPDSTSTHKAADWFANVVKPISDAIVQLRGPSPALGWTTLTLLNSWVQWSTTGQYPALQVQRQGGIVWMRGLVKNGVGTGAGSPIAILPVDMRPTTLLTFTQVSTNNGVARVAIDPAGNIYIAAYETGASNSFVFLDLTYVAE